MAAFMRASIKLTRALHNTKFLLPQSSNDTNTLLTRAYATSSSDVARSVALSDEVIIPTRVTRSPTAILETLSALAGKDPVAPHFNFMDDPYLIPTSSNQKRTYSLSKASGKKTAQWAIENYPGAFENELIAEPRIVKFMPKVTATQILKDHGESMESLHKLISCEHVEDAWKLYCNLKDGVQPKQDLQHKLLELLCAYNGKNKGLSLHSEEIFYQRDLGLQPNRRTVKKAWDNSGPANTLFDELSEKSAHAYNCLIQGMCKYYAAEDAHKMYDEMVDKNLEVIGTTYNALIEVIPYLTEDNDTKWGRVIQLLKDMQSNSVHPTLQTFNATLSSIHGMGRWQKMRSITLQTLCEMKACNVEPSLGTWAIVLQILYYSDTYTSDILYSILDQLEGQKLTLQHSADFDFFTVAMSKCHINLKDIDVAKRIDQLLHYGNNSTFLGDAVREATYYNHYLKLLCSLDLLENVMLVYERSVPHTFTPNIGALVDLLGAIELYDGHRYLPQIWSDLQLFELTRRDDLVVPLLRLMASRKHPEQVQENCHAVITNIKNMIVNAEETEQFNLPVHLSGPVISSLISIGIHCNDLEIAHYYFDLYNKRSTSVEGLPSVESLQHLALACVEKADVNRFIEVVHKMYESSFPTADVIEKGKAILELNDYQQQRLNMLASSGAT